MQQGELTHTHPQYVAIQITIDMASPWPLNIENAHLAATSIFSWSVEKETCRACQMVISHQVFLIWQPEDEVRMHNEPWFSWVFDIISHHFTSFHIISHHLTSSDIISHHGRWMLVCPMMSCIVCLSTIRRYLEHLWRVNVQGPFGPMNWLSLVCL